MTNVIDEKEKLNFLSTRIKQLTSITSELESAFPEKSFTVDGILLGNIVEIMASIIYGINLYGQSERTHDGEVTGRKVQIKGTQNFENIVIRGEPEFLLVEFLDIKDGIIKELYNGPGSLAWEHKSSVKSANYYTIRVNKLIELNKVVRDEDRIAAIMPIERVDNDIENFDYSSHSTIKRKSKSGKTLVTGYINRNNQENLGCLNKPGNHYNQLAYKMKCKDCGHEYEANGCDVAIRKCPICTKKK